MTRIHPFTNSSTRTCSKLITALAKPGSVSSSSSFHKDLCNCVLFPMGLSLHWGYLFSCSRVTRQQWQAWKVGMGHLQLFQGISPAQSSRAITSTLLQVPSWGRAPPLPHWLLAPFIVFSAGEKLQSRSISRLEMWSLYRTMQAIRQFYIWQIHRN